MQRLIFAQWEFYLHKNNKNVKVVLLLMIIKGFYREYW
ncbi:hypothetical protein SAMN05880580_11453 [Priestia flexa]|nr:hypothetical protein SAMN05880580_11453 [Priestia flexa]